MFGWLRTKRALLREIAELKAFIHLQPTTIEGVYTEDECNQKLAKTMASMHHHMQAGDEWSFVYGLHLSKLSPDVASYAQKFTEENKVSYGTRHVNYDTNPVFDFPLKPGEVYVRPRDRFRQQIRGVITVKDLDAYIPPKKD